MKQPTLLDYPEAAAELANLSSQLARTREALNKLPKELLYDGKGGFNCHNLFGWISQYICTLHITLKDQGLNSDE